MTTQESVQVSYVWRKNSEREWRVKFADFVSERSLKSLRSLKSHVHRDAIEALLLRIFAEDILMELLSCAEISSENTHRSANFSNTSVIKVDACADKIEFDDGRVLTFLESERICEDLLEGGCDNEFERECAEAVIACVLQFCREGGVCARWFD